MATTASSAASSIPVISLAATFDHFQGVAQHLGFDARYGLCEPGQCCRPVTGLVQRGQHQLGYVGLAGSGGAIRQARPSRSRLAKPFFASLSSTVMTVV
jgi:hypothetical protein